MVARLFGIAVSVILFAAAPVAAQEYPNKVITMIVPFTAGGPTDTVARLISAPMTKTLKQQVIVEMWTVPGGPSPLIEWQK